MQSEVVINFRLDPVAAKAVAEVELLQGMAQVIAERDRYRDALMVIEADAKTPPGHVRSEHSQTARRALNPDWNKA